MENIKEYFFALFKAKKLDTSEMNIKINWELVKNLPQDKLLNAIKKAMVTKYAFFEIADLIELVNGGNEDNQRIEKEWAEVLAFKRMGDSKISLKSKLVMKNLGGMNWLWDSMKNEVDFKKRNFIDAWKNTPEPIDNDFRCQGIEDNRVYIAENNTKQIEG